MNHLLRKLMRRPIATTLGKVYDVAFAYGSPSGIIGRATRTISHPPDTAVNDATNPIAFYGCVGVATAAGTVRQIAATDTSGGVLITGIAVQAFPYQQATTTAPYGASAFSAMSAPAGGHAIGYIRSGWACVYCNGAATVNITTPVYVWNAASTGTHIQGTFEATATVGSTVLVANAFYNGPGDAATGAVEIGFNI
jgi:hypothetical protein